MNRKYRTFVSVAALSLISGAANAQAQIASNEVQLASTPAQSIPAVSKTKALTAPLVRDEDRVWCRQVEGKLTRNIKLPGGFDEKKAGNLKTVIQFHVSLDGTASKFKSVKKNETDKLNPADKLSAKNKPTSEDKADISVTPKQLADVEAALITAIKSSQPLTPIPQSFKKSGEDVSFAYEPNGSQRVQVLVVK